jgi:hypothetical protein
MQPTSEARISVAIKCAMGFQRQMFNGARYGQPGCPTFQAIIEILGDPEITAEYLAEIERDIEAMPAIAVPLNMTNAKPPSAWRRFLYVIGLWP